MIHNSAAFARVLDRARGVLYGQVIGDNLGALVEFCSAEDIAKRYPYGVRELADGGTHNIAAGQPTDDSEMALALARSLVRCEGYDADDVRESYVRWANSDAFDIGEATTAALLRRAPNPNSQANARSCASHRWLSHTGAIPHALANSHARTPPSPTHTRCASTPTHVTHPRLPTSSAVASTSRAAALAWGH